MVPVTENHIEYRKEKEPIILASYTAGGKWFHEALGVWILWHACHVIAADLLWVWWSLFKQFLLFCQEKNKWNSNIQELSEIKIKTLAKQTMKNQS